MPPRAPVKLARFATGKEKAKEERAAGSGEKNIVGGHLGDLVPKGQSWEADG